MISVALVAWFLLGAMDDLVILLAWAWAVWEGDGVERPPGATGQERERRIAIFVPAWREHAVIGRMLEKNLASLEYGSYLFLVGAYPNDPLTQEAVLNVAARDSRVRLVVCDKPGPTSKADCLNNVYEALGGMENEQGEFELVMIHDAEDILHPGELRLKNAYAAGFDMIQTAVLPFPTPARQLTHGLYCDDFAEFHTKDLRARQWLGGFVPSCGVATAFSREWLAELARQSPGGKPFDPASLTEDYELGYRLHQMGARQIFVPLPAGRGLVSATREYFPQKPWAAARQRSRWISGIVFQGWRKFGWGRNPLEAYWFWRDRKGMIGCPISLVTTVVLAGQAFGGGRILTFSNIPGGVLFATLALSVINLLARAWFSSRIFGWPFGLLAPIRQLWGNLINTIAISLATMSILRSALSGQGLAWRKTDHSLPGLGAQGQERSLPDILISKGWIGAEELSQLAVHCPKGVGLAEYLWKINKLTADQIQTARNEQLGLDESLLNTAETHRSLPATVADRWRVIPMSVGQGEMIFAAVNLPDPAFERELLHYTKLRAKLVFVTPARYDRLRAQYHRLRRQF
jgi:bacteriophage N4 adsorption protein B